MKKKWLVAVAVPMLLLAGCSGTTHKQDTKPVSEEVKKDKLTSEEYTSKIKELAEILNANLESLNQLAQTKPSKERNAQLKDALKETQSLIDQFQVLQPPKELQEVQDNMDKAMDQYEKMVDARKMAIKLQSEKYWNKSNEYLKKGDTYWMKAGDLLQKWQDQQPVGDGSITGQDLKDLDKQAGIDRDSVRHNVSQDGHELAGKWGYKNKDGTFMVSIVLKPDGSYEGYGNDTYPNKDNAFFGTWKYDSSKHVMTINNDKIYLDGKEATANRHQMHFDVQSFADGKMKLMDVETYNEFFYTKMKSGDKLSPAKEYTPKDKESYDSSTSSTSSASSSTASNVSATKDDVAHIWSGESVDKNEMVTLNLGKYGTFVNSEWKKDIDQDRIYTGDWNYDEASQTIVLTVKETKESAVGDKLPNEVTTMRLHVLSVTDKEMKVEYNGKQYVYKILAR